MNKTVRNVAVVTFATIIVSVGTVFASSSYGKLIVNKLVVNETSKLKGDVTAKGDLTVEGNLTTKSLSDVLGTDVTTWSAKITSVWDNTVTETSSLSGTDLTVTFTPTNTTSGIFSATPVNIFNPYEQIAQSANVGTVTGNYTIVGNTMLIDSATPTSLTTGLTVSVNVIGNGTLIFEDQRTTPHATVVLTPAIDLL